MPERIIAMLTGTLPEPILIIPFETWKTFELTGDDFETILTEIISAWNLNREKLFSIGEEIKCNTIKYTNMIGGLGTGIIVPKRITQQYGIRTSYYLEVVLKKVIRIEEELDIFPKREVFEHYPFGFEKILK